jgi:D-alanyl-D-alanine carboxypeptidase
MRELLHFDELGIVHTYQESIDPVPPGQPGRLHQWFGDLDTYDWDPSLDLYGGGGLVSTATDLATFVEALLGGKVFEQAGTLETMLSVPPTNLQVSVPGNPVSLAAGAGIFRTDAAGHRCWGHEGFWGVQVLRCPEARLTVVVSRSQASPPPTYSGAQLGGVVLDLLAALEV